MIHCKNAIIKNPNDEQIQIHDIWIEKSILFPLMLNSE